MNKKILVIILSCAILAAISIGLIFFLKKNFNNILADRKLTKTLPENVKNIIVPGSNMHNFPTELSSPPLGFNKYLYLEYGAFSDEGVVYDYSYVSKINKELNTDIYINDSDLDGLVLCKTITETVGHYGDDKKTPAIQIGYELNFLKLSDNTFIHCDTIWGETPPDIVRKRRNESGKAGIGGLPNTDDVVTLILNKVK